MGAKSKPARRDPALVNQWRSKIPEKRRIIEEVGPRSIKILAEHRRKDIPQPWIEMVSTLQKKVYEAADQATYFKEETIQQRRGYQWHFEVSRIADMMEYLIRVIEHDIFGEDDGTIASTLLVRRALIHLELELQEGGTENGRGDGEEMQYRMQQAIKALWEEFDDVHLRRFRALQVAEYLAKWISHPPDEEEIKASIERIKRLEPTPPDFDEYHRRQLQIDRPVFRGVKARSELVAVDERFAALDPLVAMEEFAEAESEKRGGKSDGGEGRIGPVRALARLAVMCGALDYEQRDGETFDDAVERARTNLLVTRCRIRKSLNSFPGPRPP